MALGFTEPFLSPLISTSIQAALKALSSPCTHLHGYRKFLWLISSSEHILRRNRTFSPTAVRLLLCLSLSSYHCQEVIGRKLLMTAWLPAFTSSHSHNPICMHICNSVYFQDFTAILSSFLCFEIHSIGNMNLKWDQNRCFFFFFCRKLDFSTFIEIIFNFDSKFWFSFPHLNYFSFVN